MAKIRSHNLLKCHNICPFHKLRITSLQLLLTYLELFIGFCTTHCNQKQGLVAPTESGEKMQREEKSLVYV